MLPGIKRLTSITVRATTRKKALAMGSPFGLSKSITLGIISAKGRRISIRPSQGTIAKRVPSDMPDAGAAEDDLYAGLR